MRPWSLFSCLLPLAVLAATTGCPSEPPPTAPPPLDPQEVLATLEAPGEWSIGYTSESLSYDDGLGTVDRTLHAAYWYPTEQAGGAYRYRDLYPTERVLEGAEVAGDQLPVLVFSHGNQAYAEAASYLAEHLASHGWIVAAVDHTDNTIFDPPERDAAIYLQRPRDISAVLDHLYELPGGHVLEGAAGDTVMAMGHSFGGYTVLGLAGSAYAVDDMIAGCENGSFSGSLCSGLDDEMIAAFRVGAGDARIDGVVPLAVGNHEMYGDEGLGEAVGPFLHMTGGLDEGADNDTIFQALPQDNRTRVHIADAGHNSFVDLADTFRPAEGQVAGEEGHRITRIYVLAFAWQLQGNNNAAEILNGSVTVDAETEVMR